MGVDHYENFPVASVLCPPALRPAVVAIYHFARTADDMADEGDAPSEQRLADLLAYRAELDQALRSANAGTGRWPQVFGPLAAAQRRHGLPPPLLHDLLSAFEQDARNPPHPDRASLLDYCRRSANPIGRLLLHLYGVDGEREQAQSDAICTSLQLINFWQDLGKDQARGRDYLPRQDRQRFGLPPPESGPLTDGPALRALLRELCTWALGLMHDGAPLVHRLPGRAGWELRLVVQGGLRILERIADLDHATMLTRPKLTALDAPRLLVRALLMSGRAAR